MITLSAPCHGHIDPQDPEGAAGVGSGTLPNAVVQAASLGDASAIISWLADDRCVIDACSPLDGCTALHAAARAGHVNLVRLLLESGADVLVVDSDMRTPLHHVAAAGHGICVKALLDAGSDPEGESGFYVPSIMGPRPFIHELPSRKA